MFIVGLLLVAAGALAILAATLGGEGTAILLGAELGTSAIFLMGVGSGAAVLCGLALLRFGTRRSLQRRREKRRLTELSEQLERVEAERHADSDGDTRSS